MRERVRIGILPLFNSAKKNEYYAVGDGDSNRIIQ